MNKIICMTFGERLAEVLRQQNISKRKLAKMWGKDRSYVNKIISGSIDWPGFNVALELAVLIGVSVETLAMGVTYSKGLEYSGLESRPITADVDHQKGAVAAAR